MVLARLSYNGAAWFQRKSLGYDRLFQDLC